MLWLPILTAILFSTPGSTAAITLSEAIQIAMDRSPAIDSAKRELGISELEDKSALAGFFPSLDLSTTHGLQNTTDNTAKKATAPWTSEFSVELSEKLYDNGERITRYRITGLKRELAAIKLLQERDKLCRDIATEYYPKRDKKSGVIFRKKMEMTLN